MLLSARSKGEIAKYRVILRAYEKGYLVSIPSTENAAYDVIIDDSISLFRAQIKYADRRDGHIPDMIAPQLGKEYSKIDIDLLLIYCPLVNRVLYFLPNVFHRKRHLYIHTTNPKSKYYYEKLIW